MKSWFGLSGGGPNQARNKEAAADRKEPLISQREKTLAAAAGSIPAVDDDDYVDVQVETVRGASSVAPPSPFNATISDLTHLTGTDDSVSGRIFMPPSLRSGAKPVKPPTAVVTNNNKLDDTPRVHNNTANANAAGLPPTSPARRKAPVPETWQRKAPPPPPQDNSSVGSGGTSVEIVKPPAFQKTRSATKAQAATKAASSAAPSQSVASSSLTTVLAAGHATTTKTTPEPPLPTPTRELVVVGKAEDDNKNNNKPATADKTTAPVPLAKATSNNKPATAYKTTAPVPLAKATSKTAAPVPPSNATTLASAKITPSPATVEAAARATTTPALAKDKETTPAPAQASAKTTVPAKNLTTPAPAPAKAVAKAITQTPKQTATTTTPSPIPARPHTPSKTAANPNATISSPSRATEQAQATTPASASGFFSMLAPVPDPPAPIQTNMPVSEPPAVSPTPITPVPMLFPPSSLLSFTRHRVATAPSQDSGKDEENGQVPQTASSGSSSMWNSFLSKFKEHYGLKHTEPQSTYQPPTVAGTQATSTAAVVNEIPTKVPALSGLSGWLQQRMPGAWSNNAKKVSDSSVGGTDSSTDSAKSADALVKDDDDGSGPIWWAKVKRCASFMRSSWLMYLVIFFVLSAGLLYGLGEQLGFDIFKRFINRNINWERELNVAFLGNAYFFVNDVPRVMESVSGGMIHQNSCLHAGGSLSALLLTGNGMYKSWQSEEAMLQVRTDQYGNQINLYDFGLCSVAQVLQGYDNYIEYGNPNGTYYNDGTNPCIVDYNYDMYIKQVLDYGLPKWDYVILADQTKRMAIEEARQDTLEALAYGYAPFIKASGATPVLVDTHAFWSDQSNMTGLGDIPTFTSLIYKGVEDYIYALKKQLPKSQAPIVAPVGLAFLTIWEENYELWQKLFLEDGIHSSIYGTYLTAIVLYTTLFGHLPDEEISIPERMYYLFMDTRKIIGNANSYPTTDEAQYFRAVAKRVALQGYVPSSLKSK